MPPPTPLHGGEKLHHYRKLLFQKYRRKPFGDPKPSGYTCHVGKRRIRRKRHEQLNLLNKAGTGRGDHRKGKKRGGRPRKTARGSASHRPRAVFKPSQPLHVVLRVNDAVGSLRKRFMYRALRWATIVAANHDDARIVHLSIQRTHVHLLVEAQSRRALAKLMQGFQISAAKNINRAYSSARKLEQRRRGKVFTDRYFSTVIETPRQARHALSYVLNNWRKHREDATDKTRGWKMDLFSSGYAFLGWKGYDPTTEWKTLPDTYDPLIVWFPKTWLLQEGWKRHGLIDPFEIPSAPRFS